MSDVNNPILVKLSVELHKMNVLAKQLEESPRKEYLLDDLHSIRGRLIQIAGEDWHKICKIVETLK